MAEELDVIVERRSYQPAVSRVGAGSSFSVCEGCDAARVRISGDLCDPCRERRDRRWWRRAWLWILKRSWWGVAVMVALSIRELQTGGIK